MPRRLSKGVIKLVAPSCDKIWYYLKVWPGPSSIFNWYLFDMIQKHLNIVIVKSFEKFVKQECVHKQWPHMQMKLLTTQGYLNIYLLFYCVWILFPDWQPFFFFYITVKSISFESVLAKFKYLKQSHIFVPWWPDETKDKEVIWKTLSPHWCGRLGKLV